MTHQVCGNYILQQAVMHQHTAILNVLFLNIFNILNAFTYINSKIQKQSTSCWKLEKQDKQDELNKLVKAEKHY